MTAETAWMHPKATWEEDSYVSSRNGEGVVISVQCCSK